MKTVYLMRHAKAERGGRSGSDHDRELTDKGRRQARRMGRFLQATEQIPDRLVSSTAVRARDTAGELTEGGAWTVDVPLRQTKALYRAVPEAVIQEIQSTSPKARSVLLVGHQPAWAAAVAELTGGSSIRFPTGACARIDAEVDAWTGVREGSGSITWLLPPRLLL